MQLKAFDILLELREFIARGGEGDILSNGHVREEGVILEEIPDAASLGRQVDILSGIVKGSAVQGNGAAIGRFNAGNAFERYGLAATASSEQREDLITDAEGNLKGKVAEAFPNRDI